MVVMLINIRDDVEIGDRIPAKHRPKPFAPDLDCLDHRLRIQDRRIALLNAELLI